MIGARWGVTDAEVARRYPCDDLASSVAIELWRGVSVDAPPERVWPWLVQTRLAPYSYDWVDNLGRRSPRELLGIEDPVVGDPMSRSGGLVDVGTVRAVQHQEHLTGVILGALMSYVLVPEGPGTRLLLKIVLERRRWWGPALALGDWPMARRQLLNLKQLAEGT